MTSPSFFFRSSRPTPPTSSFRALIATAVIFWTSIVPSITSAETPTDDTLGVTTWNIEHLGSPGRGFGSGFGGFGRGSIPERWNELPKRTPEQLKDIGTLISKELKSDVIALQEMAITGRRNGRSICEPLNEIATELGSETKPGQEKPALNWRYFLPYAEETPPSDDEKNTHLGFLWNQERVRPLAIFEMTLENQNLAGKALFERKPLVGYFEQILPDGSSGVDFVLVNVHLASGQHRDENHLIAMTLIEFEITRDLARHAIAESDIIILGDFNDSANNGEETEDGVPKTSPALIQHMKFKGYTDLTTPDMGFTRMNSKLTSLIDHIMVNGSAARHLAQETATIYRPGQGARGDSALFADWRATYSDHFPITFRLALDDDDDRDFFE